MQRRATGQTSSGSPQAEVHTVGLKSDGTVVAVGWDDFAQCAVGSWDLD